MKQIAQGLRRFGRTSVVGILAMAICGGSGAAAPLDPLAVSEREAARDAAMRTLTAARAFSSRSTATATATATVKTRNAGELEMLLVERHQPDKNAVDPPRSADVYVYDYSSDTLRHAIVDVASSRVLTTREMKGVQLPLTKNEVARAFDILLADAGARRAVSQEFSRITGRLLGGPQDMQVKAFAFLSASKPEGLNAAAMRCGMHRCAQLLLSVEDVVLDVSPIVDLSNARVAQNLFN